MLCIFFVLVGVHPAAACSWFVFHATLRFGVFLSAAGLNEKVVTGTQGLVVTGSQGPPLEFGGHAAVGALLLLTRRATYAHRRAIGAKRVLFRHKDIHDRNNTCATLYTKHHIQLPNIKLNPTGV